MIFCNQHGFRHISLCIIASCFPHSLSLQRARERSRKNEIMKRESRSAYFFSRRKQQKPPHPRRRRKSQAQNSICSQRFGNHGPIASSAGWNHKIPMCIFCFIIAFSSRCTKCALPPVSRVWFFGVVVSERRNKKERDTKKVARARNENRLSFGDLVYTKFTDAW